MVKNSYFEDLHLIAGGVNPACTEVLDQRFPGTWSLEFLLSGRMAYAIGDGPSVVLDRPSVFWHQPRFRYRYGAMDSEGWYHHWMLMSGSRAKRMIEIGLAPLSASGYLFVPEPQVAHELFSELVALIREADSRNHPRAVALLESLLARIITWSQRDEHMDPHRDAMESLATAMRRIPEKNWDFEAESKTLGLSMGHFRRLFRRHLSRSPYDHLLHCRIQAAADRLRDGSESIAEVAAKFQLGDAAMFSKTFRRRIGLSPSSYRRGIPRS